MKYIKRYNESIDFDDIDIEEENYRYITSKNELKDGISIKIVSCPIMWTSHFYSHRIEYSEYIGDYKFADRRGYPLDLDFPIEAKLLTTNDNKNGGLILYKDKLYGIDFSDNLDKYIQIL